MKSKKKLLLLGVGAMSALALGVGATSTFAWYKVESTVKVQTAETGYSITANASTVSVANVRVLVTLTPDYNSNGGLELTHTDGKTGAIVAGNPVTQTPTATKVIGSLTASAEFIDSEGRKDGDDGYVAPTSDQLQALQNKFWAGTFKPEGNVVLLSSGSDASDTYKVEGQTGHFEIAFKADGTINSCTIKSGEQYFAIRTNNPTGAEWMAATDAKGQVPTTVWASPTSHNTSAASGAIVKITTGASSSAEVWKLSAAEVENTAPTGNRIDHGADQIVIQADLGSAVVAATTL